MAHSTAYTVIVVILALISLGFCLYLLFCDKNMKEDIEINNIYKRLLDNQQMQNQINKDLDDATIGVSIQEQIDYN